MSKRREENLYKRGDTWCLCYTAKGHRVRESLRTGDVKLARSLRDKRIVEISRAVHHGMVRRSWEDAVTAWATHSTGQLSATTLKRYAVSLKQCETHFHGRDIAALDGKSVQEYVQNRRQQGATPATVRRDLTAISRVLEYAEALGWREGNPTLSKRRLLKERRDPIELPRSEDISLILDASSSRFGVLIKAAVLTGCRQNELVQLTWKQFNLRAKTLEIIGKGNKRRTIQLSDEAARHIATTPHTLGSEFVFCQANGLPFSQAASDFTHVRWMVESRARRDGSPFRRFRFHDLRHLFAVEALRGGMGIYHLSKHLGHSSVGTTEIYLAFLTPEEAEQAKAKSA